MCLAHRNPCPWQVLVDVGLRRATRENADPLPHSVGTQLSYPNTSMVTVMLFLQKVTMQKASTPRERHWHQGIANWNTRLFTGWASVPIRNAMKGQEEASDAVCQVHCARNR